MTTTLDKVRALSDEEFQRAARLIRGYFPTGRPEQKPDDGDWRVWAYVAGRGTGKTRAGAEWIVEQALTKPRTDWAVVAPTRRAAQGTCFESRSGVLTVLRRRHGEVQWNKHYNRIDIKISLPNGSSIAGFTAEEPDNLRGPQHDGAWADELAAWRYPDAWDQMQFGKRHGEAKVMVTTTPKPVPLIIKLRDRCRDEGDVVWHSGSTFDNQRWLSAVALEELKRRYEGTRLGRQELYAELLEDVPGALWMPSMIDSARGPEPMLPFRPQPGAAVEYAPDRQRVVVAVDPSGGVGDDHDEQGIVVASRAGTGDFYVLDDRSCQKSPDGWGRKAVQAYLDFGADSIVVETNYGGDMAMAVIDRAARDMGVRAPVRKITASRGKRQRAEPVAALYEQGRVHHVGVFAELEEQLCQWTPESGTSPDRLDALVWAITELDSGRRSGARCRA